ncbi:hypothetical protein QQP08_004226 [Theobroma cacao]|nr:hypothetical protein QQP08_004226 [Theobroma cacao]
MEQIIPKSYCEALTMSSKKNNEVTGGDKAKEENGAVGKDKAKEKKEREVITIATNELDWLNCSALGHLHSAVSCNAIQSKLFQEDNIRRFDYALILVEVARVSNITSSINILVNGSKVTIQTSIFNFESSEWAQLIKAPRLAEEGLGEESTTGESSQDDEGEIPKIRPTEADELDSKRFGTDGHWKTSQALRERHENGQIEASLSHVW